jgi:ribokinase
MSWIGDDTPGEEMVTYLKGQGVNTDEMVIEPGMKSNYHYVLRFGADRTKLQRFEDYAYTWRDPAVKPDWIYLGVLGEKTWPLHEAILQYLEQNPEIKLVFQPGMYHLMWGTEKLAPFYKHAEIVIMNREEAAQVTGRERGHINGLIDGLHDLGVHVAVVTDGADGAYASDGKERLFMPNYPDPKPPLDRTGAGDAFASTIAAALMLGESLETAMRWAPINSMSVVQQMGAQAGLLSREDLQRYLDTAPEDYQARKME